MRNPDEREVTLGPGKFTCFDYNREIHWIETRPHEGSNALDERMVLKIHFYDYPAVLETLGHLFGKLNANYNFFARRAFLVSQFPDRSAFSRLVARGINAITLFGGSAEAVYGYMNAGIVLLVGAAVGWRLKGLLLYAGPMHLAVHTLSFVFRSNTLGQVSRDNEALLATTLVLLVLGFAAAQASKVHLLSLVVATAGGRLACMGYKALGRDMYHGGAQLAPAALASHGSSAWANGFPVSEALGHPVAVGFLVSLLGLRLHPTFGKEHAAALGAMAALTALGVCVEALDLHVPPSHGYFAVYADFARFHAAPGNVYAHLATTGVALLGALGLAFRFGLGRGKQGKQTGKDGKVEKMAHGPFLATALTWLLVRYSVPDDDVAYACVGLVFLLASVAWSLKPSAVASVGLLVLGGVAQEFAHHAYNEVTYMNAYIADAATAGTPAAYAAAAGTFALHNVWLLPFEVRAALNAVTASLAPAIAPGTI